MVNPLNPTCPVINVDSGFSGVQSVSFSPMGDVVAAGCANGKVHLLDAVTGAVKRSLHGHTYKCENV
jgi:WD40 repeat protein